MINFQNMAQMMSMMNGNPKDMVLSKLNLPQGINANDPNAILKHLVDSGRVSQQDVDAMMQIARMFMK